MSPSMQYFVKCFDAWSSLNIEDPDYGKCFTRMLTARKALTDYDFFDFIESINAMNRRYELPIHDVPTLPQDLEDRLEKFQSILKEELHEGQDIDGESHLDMLTAIADWLGDILVFTASESRKYGLPIMKVLQIIMASNESKLGDDGKPIKDDRGKFLKGPHYWRPEPRISAVLSDMRGET